MDVCKMSIKLSKFTDKLHDDRIIAYNEDMENFKEEDGYIDYLNMKA